MYVTDQMLTRVVHLISLHTHYITLQSGASHLAADLAAIPRLSVDEFKKLVDEQSSIIIDTRNVSNLITLLL